MSAPLSGAASSLVGRALAGRYRVVGSIGEGGMAMIFSAEQEDPPHEVAVKVLHPRLARVPAFAKRFRREASVASRLTHPNIVRVLDYGAESDCFFIVMELLHGEDLYERLSREGTLDERRAVGIVIEICEALSEAHGQGIVHRDLKPENIFLSRSADGREGVKILDFGIAKMLEPEALPGDSQPTITVLGSVMGTPEYMSPEQCRGESPGPRSDIYACGALLYALLTGAPPFEGATPMEIICKHVGDAPVPPSALRPGLLPGIEAAVLKALAKDPRDRHASAATLAAALRAALAAPTRYASACMTLRPRLLERAPAPIILEAPAPAPIAAPAPLVPLAAAFDPPPAPRLPSSGAISPWRPSPSLPAPAASPLFSEPPCRPSDLPMDPPLGRRPRALFVAGSMLALALVGLALARCSPAPAAPGRSTRIVVVR